MKFLFLLLLLTLTKLSYNQNLIPNGSFEQITFCPNSFAPIDSVLFWMNPAFSILFGGNGGSPDFFTSCASFQTFSTPYNFLGYQVAHSGSVYAGLVVKGYTSEFREYIEVPIYSTNGPLAPNQCYHFEMYINLGNNCMFTTHNLGIYFSDTAVHGINNYFALPFTPQITNTLGNNPDSINWTLVSGNYFASGGETHLIIGNFDNDSITAITTVTTGAGPSNGTYIYIDDVSLVPCTPTSGLPIEKIESKVYPNPFNEELNFYLNDNGKFEITIFDNSERSVYQDLVQNGTKVRTDHLERGTYFYIIRKNEQIIGKGKLIKF
jgi:hypothetical protein